MKTSLRRFPLTILALGLMVAGALAQGDPLPSWNDGPTRQAIVAFVDRVTSAGSPEFVPSPERIATFDNDGNLWAEQPIYFQLLFAMDRVRELAHRDPSLKDRQPFKAIVENDREAMAGFGEHEAAAVVAATHAGMTTDEFAATAGTWLTTAKHPRSGQLYKEMIYQPMLELMAYLRANGFKTFIVSGGGIEFIRAYAEKTYGIPPEQVIGSSSRTRFELRDGKAVLVKLPEIGSVDDREGKPVNINLHIGRRPILASGNSDGDLAMLQYTASGPGARLMLVLHHDDAEREWAYDRQSKVGRLDRALDEASQRGWTVISMKRDWNTVFPAGR